MNRVQEGKEKKKPGKHSKPKTSGVQNLPKEYMERVEGTGGGIMEDLIGIYEKGFANRRDYAGKWDEDSLESEVHDFFKYCAQFDVKPAKSGLRLWLGLSRSQYHEWETNTSSHPLKSDILDSAHSLMEMQYITKGESHPTMNMFLLKSGHGHSDKQEVQITGTQVDSDSIAESISKLGLGEK